MGRWSLAFHAMALCISAQTAWAESSVAAKTGGLRMATPLQRLPSENRETDDHVYADTFLPLREDVRAFERDPANRYTYCIRNVATYECLSYSSDGNLRRRQYHTTAHGTGFAYQIDGDQTRLLTNEHVVAWPFVTDVEHRVTDVPLGCKLITQKLQIVDNEDDEYEADDIPLSRVVDDKALDAAVVRAKGKLRLLPYRIGRSSALSTGDVVIVRGFPLGVFAAYNTGKIINTLDEDRYQAWDHADFIVDAQLSSGNSGSPVLALNHKTGEYELVGLFHASYSRASSLNAVIAIEQLHTIMFDLKPGAHAQTDLGDAPAATDSALRGRLLKSLGASRFVPYLGLGSLIVGIHSVGDRLLFEVFSKGFPLDDHPLALILDAPQEGLSGKLQQVWLGNDRGYRAYSATELDAESVGAIKRVLQRLYALSDSTLSYRELMSRVPDSRQAVQQRAAFQRTLSRAAAQDADVAQQLIELAKENSPTADEAAQPLNAVFSQLLAPVGLSAQTAVVTSAGK